MQPHILRLLDHGKRSLFEGVFFIRDRKNEPYGAVRYAIIYIYQEKGVCFIERHL